MRSAGLAAGLFVTVLVAGCAGPSDPPAASRGFFPATYTGGMVVNAPLVKSGEVGPRQTRLTFHVSVPKDEPYTVVVRCDRGRITLDLGGAVETGGCDGLSFLDNGCAGADRTDKVSVSEAQSKSWGIAVYAGRNAASNSCR